MIGGAWENKAGRTIPERMCPGEAERKAAHRLLSNHEVGMDEFPEHCLETTAERGRREICYCGIRFRQLRLEFFNRAVYVFASEEMTWR